MTCLANKTILVTGAGMGIGRAIALSLASAGAHVIVNDWSGQDGEATVACVKKAGGEASFMHADVSNASQVESMLRNISRQFGVLDAAVNNAGIVGDMGRLHDISEATFDRVIAIDLKGVWLCMKHQIALMLEHRRGAIVNIASVAGMVGEPNFGGYAAAKHGVVGLTRTAAIEYARDGIRINALCPGVIRTPMVEAVRDKLGAQAMQDFLNQKQPIGRMGEPDEVAAAAVWLCSDASSFITGQALGVDGGYLAQ